MGRADVDTGASLRVRIRLPVAIVAELIYLFGRTAIIATVEDPFNRELVWTTWRLVFVLFYFRLFLDTIRNAPERRPLSRHPWLLGSIIISIAAMPFAHSEGAFGWPDGLIDLVAVPLVALREEFFYRAILQNALERVGHPIGAILIATVFFSMSHVGAQPINPATLSSFVACGVVLGVVYHHTRNVWIVVALHAAADFVVLLPHAHPLGPSVALVGNFVAIIGALLWLANSQITRRTGV